MQGGNIENRIERAQGRARIAVQVDKRFSYRQIEFSLSTISHQPSIWS